MYANGQKIYVYETLWSPVLSTHAPGLLICINPLSQLKSNFMWSREEGMKVYINSQGHMLKMTVIAYDIETWHETSGNGALQSLYKV